MIFSSMLAYLKLAKLSRFSFFRYTSCLRFSTPALFLQAQKVRSKSLFVRDIFSNTFFG